MDFRKTTVQEIAAKVKSRELSAAEVTQAALDNIERLNPIYNAFCSVQPELALAAAQRLDDKIASGGDPGPLAGVPLGVKDLEDAADYVTTYGSALHVDDEAATGDSILVSRLCAAGCIVLGKTNTPEFGYKGQTDNIPFGPSRNPFNTDRTPGGSSGGTSAALAAGMIPLGTGSDGGGSIRIPSAVCGLSGIKTSQGRVPCGGVRPTGSGILTVKGPMANTTAETLVALDACMGDDQTDIFGLPGYEASLESSVIEASAPYQVIWSPTMGFANVDTEIAEICEQAIQRIASQGTNVVVRDAIWEKDPVMEWLAFWTSARARAQGDLIGTADWEKIDPGLRPQIEMGMNVTGVQYANAIDACHTLNYALEKTFAEAPIIITPAVSGHTPGVTGGGFVNGEETPGWVGFTYGINMTRNPAGVVPVGMTKDGMPVALQFIGRQRDDATVLTMMLAAEKLFERPMAEVA
ncbi:MAG: amidase [Pseudomonadota bacterium]